MTVIVAIENGHGAWIACDSHVGDGSYSERMTRPKWTERGRLLIATCGPVQAGNIIEDCAPSRQPRSGETFEHFLTHAWAVPLRLKLEKLKLLTTMKDEFDALILYRGRVFRVDDHLGVYSVSGGYTAIGAGRDFALGSLASTSGDPRRRCDIAVMAAVAHSPIVRPPTWVKFQGVK